MYDANELKEGIGIGFITGVVTGWFTFAAALAGWLYYEGLLH